MELLEPKELSVKTLAGVERTYIISKFPAIAGREIVCSYPLSALPKLAEYSSNEAIMLKLMTYVAVDINSNRIRLETKALVDNHIPDWETLVKVELEMMKYNTSFFREGVISTFSSAIGQKVLASITPTLIRLLPQLSVAVKQLLKN